MCFTAYQFILSLLYLVISLTYQFKTNDMNFSLLTILFDKLTEAKNIGLTQSKIAEELGISTNTISRYKSQKGQMTTETYERIINYINNKLNETKN